MKLSLPDGSLHCDRRARIVGSHGKRIRARFQHPGGVRLQSTARQHDRKTDEQDSLGCFHPLSTPKPPARVRRAANLSGKGKRTPESTSLHAARRRGPGRPISPTRTDKIGHTTRSPAKRPAANLRQPVARIQAPSEMVNVAMPRSCGFCPNRDDTPGITGRKCEPKRLALTSERHRHHSREQVTGSFYLAVHSLGRTSVAARNRPSAAAAQATLTR